MESINDKNKKHKNNCYKKELFKNLYAILIKKEIKLNKNTIK